MPLTLHDERPDLAELVRLEKLAFAAKLRTARALIGWSQGEFGFRVGLTQRAIHKLEQGETEPRRTTVHAVEELWRAQGIEFEDTPGGGFRLIVRPNVIGRLRTAPSKRRHNARVHLGVTAVSPTAAYRY